MAYAFRAFGSKCANVVRTHDEFPCSRPSPCTCAYFLSSPSKPPASPPLLPSIRFSPFHRPFFRESIPLSPSPDAQPGSCLSANVKGVAVPTRHVHLIPDFGAYSREFDPLVSVQYYTLDPSSGRFTGRSRQNRDHRPPACLMTGPHQRRTRRGLTSGSFIRVWSHWILGAFIFCLVCVSEAIPVPQGVEH